MERKEALRGAGKPRPRAFSTIESSKFVRVAVLGQDGVGKSAFTVRLLTGRFIGDYDGTLESTHRHRVEVDGELLNLEVLDTAGKNSIEKIDLCSKADLFFVLYSTTDQASFQEARLIVKYLLETKNVACSKIVLVATKDDLKKTMDVTEYQGRILALSLSCSFHQISNSEGFTSQEILSDSLRRVMKSVSSTRPPTSPLLKIRKGFKQFQESRQRSGSFS